MPSLSVRLFGKLAVWSPHQEFDGLVSRKVQELFCHLLLYGNHSHSRETLATLLWGDNPTTQAKKSLRHALWQLQTALHGVDHTCDRLLQIEPEWIQLNTSADVWVDALEFERVYSESSCLPSVALTREVAEDLRRAVELYQGDLLEGWYQDWCLYERERFQTMYLAMLDKLVIYSEAQREYEAGLAYATRVLRFDRARERTHRDVMRMYYLSGDRATALRQFERCVAALSEELGVSPSQRTLDLYEQIRADRLVADTPAPATEAAPVGQILDQLLQLRATLADVQQQVHHHIEAIEQMLRAR